MKRKIFDAIKYTLMGVLGFIFVTAGISGCFTKHGWDFFGEVMLLVIGVICLVQALSITEKKMSGPVLTLLRYVIVVALSINGYVETKKLVQSDINKQNLETALHHLDKPLSSTRYSGSIVPLADELRFFDSLVITINKGTGYDDEHINQLAEQLKAKVGKVQKKEFPILRQEYADYYAKQSQKYGMLISTEQPGNTILDITDSLITTKAIADTHNGDVTPLFRFKEIRYRKSKDDAQYISYWLNTPEDSVVKLTFE